MCKRIFILILIFITLTPITITFAYNDDDEYIDYIKIDNLIKGEMAARKIPGMQLGIIKNDEIIYINDYGEATRENNKPYIIASVSKTFTALAIRQLINQGKLNDYDKVIKYLPWFTTLNKTQSDKISINDLIEHKSGFSTYEGIDDYEVNEDFDDLENYVHNLKDVELKPPNTYEYSDVNYNILGLIIEKVSGESYGNYINEHIFKPLDMNNSYVLNKEDAYKIVGQGYEILFDTAIKSNSEFNNSSVPSGFLASTAYDMCKYMVTYLNGEGLIGKEYNKDVVKFNQYWQEKDDIDFIYHSGFVNNFNSDMSIYPYTGFGIILLSDVDESYFNNISTISDEIYSILTTGNVKVSEEGERIRNFQNIVSLISIGFIVVFVLYILLVILSIILFNSNKKTSKKYLLLMLGNTFIIPLIIYSITPSILNAILDKNMYITWRNISYFVCEGTIWKRIIIGWILIGSLRLIIIYNKNKKKVEDNNVKSNKITT